MAKNISFTIKVLVTKVLNIDYSIVAFLNYQYVLEAKVTEIYYIACNIGKEFVPLQWIASYL